ncbi:merozoite surface protein, putative [Plasmodium ovale curtisi]|nr:merozoite surface protein, putative [Plasmodium ovale curtisi]SBS92945.1 merozoite surface protein, putative [Plasmodium ovale curtisi]
MGDKNNGKTYNNSGKGDPKGIDNSNLPPDSSNSGNNKGVNDVIAGLGKDVPGLAGNDTSASSTGGAGSTAKPIASPDNTNLGMDEENTNAGEDDYSDSDEYEDEEDDTYELSGLDVNNVNLCLDNNGGCGDDKICEYLGKGIVKCLCKAGYKLIGTDCVKASDSSSLSSIFCWFLIVIIILASIN